jgi:hypothetical protein
VAWAGGGGGQVEKREGRVVVPGDGVLLAGRYRLQDRIAAGGAGEVWRAADAVLGRARRPTSPLDDLKPGQMPSAPDAADLALHNLATQRAIALVSALPPL